MQYYFGIFILAGPVRTRLCASPLLALGRAIQVVKAQPKTK